VLHARGPVRAIGFEDSHTLLAAVGRRVERVDLKRRMPRLGLVSDNPHAIFDLATGRAGTFVTRGADGTVRLWGLGRRVALADQIDPRSVYDLAFSPDGHTIAAVDWKNVRLWNTATRRPAGPPVEGRPVPLKAVAFAGDDELAIGRENGSVVFVNPNHRLPRARRSSVPLIAGNDVRSVAASTDGKWVASVRGLGSISIWDVPRRRKSGDLALPAASMGSAVAFAPGRPTLAVATRATAGFRGLLGLWDVRTRRRTGRLFGDVPQGVSALAFSPKGRLLASAGGGAIRFWDVASRRSLGALRVGSTISSLTFSRDGRTLAVGAENGVSLWDVRAKSRLGKPLHAGSPTRTVAFSNDGRTLVSGGTGMWLWNAILWSRSLAAFAGRLCPVANRQLTTAEWRQYVPGEPYRKTCAEADFG
jgi:WD40 repeat protein